MLQRLQSRINLPINPLLAHELRSLMRSPRAYTVLTMYLSIVCGITVLLYIAASGSAGNGINNSSSVGTALFYVIIGMQTMLVCFLTPSFTAGAINGERERGTYDLLKMTPISPFQIVFSKLTASVGFALLLVFTTLPLLSLALLLGGVEVLQLVAALSVIVLSALLFSILGLYFSARMASVLKSTIVTFATVAGIVLGMAVFTLIAFPLVNGFIYSTSSTIKTNPFLGTLLQLFIFLLMSVSPISAMVATETNLQESGNVWIISVSPLPGSLPLFDIPAPFVILVLLHLLASIILFVRTMRCINRPYD
ncbi:MAG TPA: ABC transporter permease subunit [Anaerolineae bacterium]|jgi:ABC-type transport system involved in multi-copper enzyme maturation permease subunit